MDVVFPACLDLDVDMFFFPGGVGECGDEVPNIFSLGSRKPSEKTPVLKICTCFISSLRA